MLEITRRLADQLRRRDVRVDVPDTDTLLLRHVPINAEQFNQSQTTLVATRPSPGMPFLVCVDKDLRYLGPEAELARVFSGGINQHGHRILLLNFDAGADLQAVLDRALAVLGFDGRPPHLAPPAPKSAPATATPLLDGLGLDLTRDAEDCVPCIGRETEARQIVAALRTWGQTRLPVVAGPSGCGKTTLLFRVAGLLGERQPAVQLVSVDLAVLLAGTMFPPQRENLLSSLLEEASRSPQRIVALEHLELALFGSTPLLLAHALDQGCRLLGTMLPDFLSLLRAEPLARRLRVVRIEPLSPAATVGALAAVRPELAAHHGLEIGLECLRTCVRLADSLPGELPAKALDLLDVAASTASAAGSQILGPDDLYDASQRILEITPQED